MTLTLNLCGSRPTSPRLGTPAPGHGGAARHRDAADDVVALFVVLALCFTAGMVALVAQIAAPRSCSATR